MKKLFMALATLIGCFILFLGTGALLLILVPEINLFGVRYIGALQENVKAESINFDVSNTHSIYLQTSELPVFVTFSNNKTPQAYIYQEYCGFTKTKFNKASIKVEEQDSMLVVKTSEIIKYLTGTNYKNSKVELVLPVSLVSKNFNLNANNSNVTFQGERCEFDEVKVTTTGDVSISNKYVKIRQLSINANSVNVDGRLVNTQNVIMQTTGSVELGKAYEGDLFIKSNSGTIKFVSCKNLTIETKSASIKGYSDESPIINGTSNIQTRTGNINIGSVQGKSQISTKYGDIQAQNCQACDWYTTYGNIKVECMNAGKIKTYMGDISVKEVLSNADVTTTGGVINLSSEDGKKINNSKVYCKKGVINAYNLTGITDLSSTNANINIKGSSCSKLDINSINGTIKIDDLDCRTTTIKTNHKITISLVSLNGELNIVGQNKSVICTMPKEINFVYNIDSSNKSSFVEVGSMKAEGVSLNSSKQVGRNKINIKTNKGQVQIIESKI